MQNELKTFLEDTDPIYRAMDSFLTEFTDIEGKPIFRSIDTLNKDRRLFVEEMKKRDQRLIQKVVEILDEMAFESDDRYKVELFINWDEAKKKLNLTI